MSTVLIVLGYFALIVFAVLWRALVLSQLWSWFVVPIFDLPTLPIASAIGISIIIAMFQRDERSNSEEKKQLLERTVLIFIYPAMALFLGLIVKHWMPI